MSTISPPFTTSMTGPLTVWFSSAICWIRPQARSYWARFLERISRPSSSSLLRTRAPHAHPRRPPGRGRRCCGSRLLGGDDSLGLVPDVDHGAVGIHTDDGAFDDVPFLELGDGVRQRRLEVVGDLVGQIAHAGGDNGGPQRRLVGRGTCAVSPVARISLPVAAVSSAAAAIGTASASSASGDASGAGARLCTEPGLGEGLNRGRCRRSLGRRESPLPLLSVRLGNLLNLGWCRRCLGLGSHLCLCCRGLGLGHGG